jgi:rubrerythrin
MTRPPIRTRAELYAHAIAIEREAAERYAERRAQQLFAGVCASAEDPALRALAQELALEEQGHIAMVKRALERTPDVRVDWSTVFGD